MAMWMSGTLPGVRAKATGRPSASTKPCALLVAPPREMPTASGQAPLCGLRRAVRLHLRAVEGEFLRDRSRRCHALEHGLPYASGRPAGEAGVDGGGWPAGGWYVPPAASSLQHITPFRRKTSRGPRRIRRERGFGCIPPSGSWPRGFQWCRYGPATSPARSLSG